MLEIGSEQDYFGEKKGNIRYWMVKTLTVTKRKSKQYFHMGKNVTATGGRRHA